MENLCSDLIQLNMSSSTTVGKATIFDPISLVFPAIRLMRLPARLTNFRSLSR